MRSRFILLLCLLLISNIFSSATVLANDTETIRVGIYENQPKIFTDEDGNASGFWPEILEYIASEEGWEIQYVHGTWDQCLTRLEENEIDMMPDVAYSEDRSTLYDFSNETVYVSWSRVYTRAGIDIQSMIDLEGKFIAVLEGSVNVEGPEGIKTLVDAFDIDCTFTELDSYLEVFELVESGQADAGVASKDFANQHQANFNLIGTAIIFQPSSLYFAFPKDSTITPSLIERIDYHMKELKEDEESIYYQSLEEWLGVKPIIDKSSAFPWWLIWLLIGIGGLALLFAAGSLILRYQVRSRTKALTNEINERKQTEKRLSESEEKYRNLVELAKDGICIIQDEVIKYSNPHMAEMFGSSVDELIDTPFVNHVHPNDLPKVTNYYNRRIAGEKAPSIFEYEAVFRRKDGSNIYIELNIGTINYLGNPAELVIAHDITERKKIQEKLIVTDRLASAGELAAGVTHEINNPLTGIIGISELLLERQEIPADIKEDLSVIYNESTRASQVAKNLLTFARKHPDEKKPTDINEVIQLVVKLRTYEQRIHNIELITHLTADIPVVLANDFQLQQVFINIIINAEHFMIEAHNKGTLTITTEKQGDILRISFADDGPGIAPKHLPHIFDPFFTTKDSSKGTGLGLSICYGIITEHDGNIWVESEEGKGATFIIELPIHSVE